MKELKVLIIVLILVGVTYWGIEPYAHTKLHPHVAHEEFNLAKEDINLAKENIKHAEEKLQKVQKIGDENMIADSKKALESKKAFLDKYQAFWDEIEKIDLSKGDAKRGEELFDNAGCSGCHGLEIAQRPAPMDSKASSEAYGVNPPDLSTSGLIYGDKFLAALIKDPVMAFKLSHKFNDEGAAFPMPGFFGAGGEDPNLEIADLVAYLQSVAPKSLEDKQVFIDACVRCHDMKYDKIYMDGNRVSIANYLGSNPPDLSMMIRSKGEDYLHKFMNDTQKMLPGTSMPRVGLTQDAQIQIVNYLENIGDSKKGEREKTSIYIMIYFVILSIFATLWKRKVWSKLH